MGNSNPKGGLYIQLEKREAFAGEEVTGTVNVSLNEILPPSSVILQFTGVEKTKWTEIETNEIYIMGEKQSITRPVTYKGRHKIVNYKNTLFESQGELQQGGFTIPFSFRLPQKLPGSIEYGHLDESAFITYKFKACLETLEKEKIKGETEIWIKELVKYEEMAHGITLENRALLSTWCCIRKGSTFIKSYFLENSYTADDFPTAYVEIDNTLSQLPIISIGCILWRSIRMKGDGRTRFVKTKICEVKSLGVEVGSSLLAENAVSFELNLPAYKTEIKRTNSSNGKIVECMFSIEAKANMDGCCMCCGDTPSVSCPMIIHDSVKYPAWVPDPPEGWNPIDMPFVSMAYSEQYDYAPTAPDEGI